MIHFLYNTFEEFAFSECEPRTGVKARQTATRPRCCPVLDKLSWTRRRAESWFMSSMCLRSLVSQSVLQGWVIKTKKNLKMHKVCWWDHCAGPHQSWRPWKSGPPFLTRAVSSADLSSIPASFFRFLPQLQIAFWWRTSQRLLEKKSWINYSHWSLLSTALFQELLTGSRDTILLPPKARWPVPFKLSLSSCFRRWEIQLASFVWASLQRSCIISLWLPRTSQHSSAAYNKCGLH